MLTNEQRAHDLAIALIPTVLTSKIDTKELDENGNLHRDVFKMYLDLYYSILEPLNKEFP